MKIFGWKAAGREKFRPALARYGLSAGATLGEWPASYEAQVREAMRAVAVAFIDIAVAAGLAPTFQVGEPWWWVMADGRPCLYDDAAKVALGNPPAINVRGPQEAAARAGLDAGANLALVGDELLQFGRAEPISPTRWRLSRLLRGRRGTEAAAGLQTIGDRFVLIEPEALVAIDLPLSAIGGQVAVMASGIGDDDGPVRADVPVTGASVLPPSPVHLRIDPAGGALHWARRSRAGWRWIDGADAPLGEERESYRIDFATGASAETVSPTFAIGDDTALPVRIRQRGTNGLSYAARPD